MAQLQLSIASPERLILTMAADMVVMPGVEGYLGVLVGHMPLITPLKPGVVEVYLGSEITKKIFVSGGFANIEPNNCTLLADEAIFLEDIDRAQAEENLSKAREDLKEAQSEEDHLKGTQKIAIYEAKLKALETQG